MKPVHVGVLVDLVRAPQAGGHVRVWERIAEAATDLRQDLHLTVHFAGASDRAQALSENVQLLEHRPVFSTERLPFLPYVPGHSDLAPYHRRLAAHLGAHDVLHTTDGYFAFARTATRIADRRGIPLVNSVHTDTPSYTRVVTAATLERLVGRGWVARALTGGLRLPLRAERWMQRALEQHHRRCAFALVSRPDQAEAVGRLLAPDRVGVLRRGVDRQRFHPRPPDREALAAALGVPPEPLLVMFAGRLDRTKNVMTLIEAVHTLVEEGRPLHLLCAGDGVDRAAIAERLGPHVTCAGFLPPAQLALAYTSADLFAQPSTMEECSNVVLEALSSGLPVLVAAGSGGSGRLFPAGEGGLVVDGGEPGAWAQILRVLAGDRQRREGMGQAARAFAERSIPSWRDVLVEDLLPVWRRAAAGRQR